MEFHWTTQSVSQTSGTNSRNLWVFFDNRTTSTPHETTSTGLFNLKESQAWNFVDTHEKKKEKQIK